MAKKSKVGLKVPTKNEILKKYVITKTFIFIKDI